MADASTRLDLDAIRERREMLRGWGCVGAHVDGHPLRIEVHAPDDADPSVCEWADALDALDSLVGTDVLALLAEVERLRDGIREHRDHRPAPGRLWSSVDERLWALLDDRTETR